MTTPMTTIHQSKILESDTDHHPRSEHPAKSRRHETTEIAMTTDTDTIQRNLMRNLVAKTIPNTNVAYAPI